jgi:hypothetical protein
VLNIIATMGAPTLPWRFALIDDKENQLVFAIYNMLENVDTSVDGFLCQCVKAGYNVSDDKILKFCWGGIEWKYARLIISDSRLNPIKGFRMVVYSAYLTPYYQIKNIIADTEEFSKHFDYYQPNHVFLSTFAVLVRYENDSCGGYKIIVDIIDHSFKIEEKNDKLIAIYSR